MELVNVNPDEIIFSLDIGTRSIIGTVGIYKDKKFQVLYEDYLEHEERAMIDGQIHDITLVANTVGEVKRKLESKLDFKLSRVAIAAAGRFLRTTNVNAEVEMENDKEIDREFIRSLEITAVKKAEDQVNHNSDGKLYCVGYSVKSYYLNGYIITNLLSHKGERAGIEIIATFLPRSVVDSLYAVMKKVGLEVRSLTLEPIAAIEAAIPQSLRLLNLALVDIGAGTSDIAISSKDSISAYGMVPLAGDEVTEAIAQTYLVDFNTAENIKRQCSFKEKITYTDVIGFENEIDSQDILQVIQPVVEKISNEISSKIIELNGGKSPNAVFLVGGGAHTPVLKESIAKKLNLPMQRIAIKGRESVTDCVCSDNNLGSIGVTVLGIALVAIRKSGQDFIDVYLNDTPVSLFNSRKYTVKDVMVQAGIDPKVLIGKNGKNIRFTINGSKRLAFGSLATRPQVKINGLTAVIDSEIQEGDNIEIIYAKDGQAASPRVFDYSPNIASVSFFFNDIIYNLEPIAFMNNIRVTLEEKIKENDEVIIKCPSTIGEFIQLYLEDSSSKYKYYLKDKEINSDYNIKEGDRIYSVLMDASSSDMSQETKQPENTAEPEAKSDVKIETKTSVAGEESKIDLEKENLNIPVTVNGTGIILKNKSRYIFIDIFDFIDFDLTVAKGNLMLLLNGNKAGYYDELNSGDVIKIYWQ